MSSALDKVQNVDIDPQGTFKYILIQITDPSAKTEKFIVRGYKRCEYHADIFDEVESKQLKETKGNCVGGGRIKHDPEKETLFVYGHSTGFGQADHQKSVDILKQKFPNYEITWSNDGY